VGSLKVGQLLAPAVTAASADGRTDVSEFLGLIAQANASDGAKLNPEQTRAYVQVLVKTSPIILSDCGVTRLR